MTKWNANNYSKQMKKDIRKIRSVQRSRKNLEDQSSIPPTPNEAPSRKASSPGIFTLGRPGVPLPQSISSPQIQEIDSLDTSTYPLTQTSAGKRNSLTPAMSAGERDLTLGAIYPQSEPLNYSSQMPVEIHRIQQENNAVLGRVNNAPVQYGKTKTKEDEESHETE
jgi:hypothetical protein